MANEVASGLDALVERILSDAKNDADNTMDAAAKEAAAIAARAEQAAEGIKLDYKRRAHEAVDSIIERSTTNAQLEGRKLTLTYKRGLLDEAFSLAYERLCKLTGDERKKFLRSLAIREANGQRAHWSASSRDQYRARACRQSAVGAFKGDRRH